jgi:dTDP-4-amino-4,6-dideoxygalactose transaminase
MNTSEIESHITKLTSAIIPVHLNGRVCNMGNIVDLARKYGLIIIEDSAQAIGAYYCGKKAGTFGLAGCFSFFPAKILGCYGDGGMVVTNDDNFAFDVKAMRDYGRIKGQEQVLGYGYNSRLDNIQAVVLNYKMQFLNDWITRRRFIAQLYHDRLCNISDIVLPPKPEQFGSQHYDVYQNYVIRAVNRDGLMDYLNKQGIETYAHWITPLHKQGKLRLNYYKLPMTETLCNEVVSLPMYPELDDWQVNYVCEKIQEFYK